MADSQAWSEGWAQGQKAVDQRRNRNQGLQDEQRGLQEQAVWNDPDMSPQQKAQKIDVLFAHEPVESRMGRIGRGLQRITGQGKKADAGQQAADTKLQEQRDTLYGVPPAQAAPQGATPEPGQPAPRVQLPNPQPGYRNKQEAIAGSLSNKNQNQVDAERATAKTENAHKDAVALIEKYVPKDQQADALEDYARKQTGINSPAPRAAAETSDTRTRADFESFKKENPSYKGTFEQWKTEQSAKGRGAGSVPKALSPASQYANLMAKKLLADRKQGPPMTNEDMAQLAGVRGALTLGGISTANARADAMARNGLVVTTDPDTGMEVETQRSQAVAASRGGKPMTAGAVGAPTAQDKEKQMYAVSSLHRLKEMRSIVKAHPEVFGPIGGRTTNASVWLGSQSPEAQKFMQDAQFLAEHSTAVFGGRAASTVQALQKIQSDPKTNPEALLAGFDTDESTLNDFTTGGGRLPAPRAQGGGDQGGIIYAKDPQGHIHKAKAGTKLPKGWNLTDAPK